MELTNVHSVSTRPNGELHPHNAVPPERAPKGLRRARVLRGNRFCRNGFAIYPEFGLGRNIRRETPQYTAAGKTTDKMPARRRDSALVMASYLRRCGCNQAGIRRFLNRQSSPCRGIISNNETAYNFICCNDLQDRARPRKLHLWQTIKILNFP
jgi:hypothetical protein